MPKNWGQVIQNELKLHGQITAEILARDAGTSRQAAHKRLSQQVKRGQLKKVGKTRGTYYTLPAQKKAPPKSRIFSLRLKTKRLEEDLVMRRLEASFRPLKTFSKKSQKIVRFAFCEMLNNAIEHSLSKFAEIRLYVLGRLFWFEVIDFGVGVFNNIRKKFKLSDNYSALQELLKGKSTTAQKQHSGEGIFFTSKIADLFEIESSKIKLVIDNLLPDIAVSDIPYVKGTRVRFALSPHSQKDLAALFNEYTDEEYRFSKTKVTVKLYEHDAEYVSRSQARRLLFGMDKFQTIVLDFTKVKGVGQAFADEIFCVFAKAYPKITLQPINASRGVMFMINRARARGLQ